MFERMAREISATTAVLTSTATAGKEIDRALTVMMEQSRPVYIGVPTDLAYALISDEPLKTPLPTELPANDAAAEKDALAEIRSKIEKASQPIIVVDGSMAFIKSRIASTS
jgi:pyruvate decarboxylase